MQSGPSKSEETALKIIATGDYLVELNSVDHAGHRTERYAASVIAL
jgi:hypothetical protein